MLRVDQGRIDLVGLIKNVKQTLCIEDPHENVWSDATKDAISQCCNAVHYHYIHIDINTLDASLEDIEELYELLYSLSKDWKQVIDLSPNVKFASKMLWLLNFRHLEQIKNYIEDETLNLNQSKLQKIVKNLKSVGIQPLAQIASDLLNEVSAEAKKQSITRNDKYKLANILDAASQLIETMSETQDNPFDLKPNSHFFKKLYVYENAVNNISGMNRDTRRMVLGAALALAGFALLTASVTLAVLTFGVSSSLSIAAAAVSTKLMIAGAVTMGVTAVAGLSLGVANGIFANRERKGALACLAEDFADEARAIKGSKKWC